jgi:hypothetical protein
MFENPTANPNSLCSSSCFLKRAEASKLRANNSSRVPNLSFCNLCSLSNFTNTNVTQLDLEIQNTRILVTIQNEPRVRLNVFNQDGRYHHLRKYLTFLQNSLVYGTMRKVKQELSISHRQSTYLSLSNGL